MTLPTKIPGKQPDPTPDHGVTWLFRSVYRSASPGAWLLLLLMLAALIAYENGYWPEWFH